MHALHQKDLALQLCFVLIIFVFPKLIFCILRIVWPGLIVYMVHRRFLCYVRALADVSSYFYKSLYLPVIMTCKYMCLITHNPKVI